MRIIKYRAWCEKYKLMLPVQSIDFNRGNQIIIKVIVPPCKKYHDKLHDEIYGDDCQLFGGEEIEITYDFKRAMFPVFLFTDIYDKNKKEIYVGDIVKFEYNNYEVIFSEYYGCFGLLDRDAPEWRKPNRILVGHGGSSTKYLPYLWNWLSKKVEVVGDIYTTPELLK
jgi:hypothetical protein